MNWVLGLIGALVGVGVAESRELLGAVVGFFSMYLLLSVNRLRGELAALSREMAVTKARIAALSATAASAPGAAPAAPVGPQLPNKNPHPSPMPRGPPRRRSAWRQNASPTQAPIKCPSRLAPCRVNRARQSHAPCLAGKTN